MSDMADAINDFGADCGWRDFQGITCKRQCNACGRGNLVWAKMAAGWRLVDAKTHRIHSCKEYVERVQR